MNYAAITRFTLCSPSMGVRGPCTGDAGGPLYLINEQDGIRTQVGHATGAQAEIGGECDYKTYTYTDLSPFLGWIHRRISGCGNYPINKGFVHDKPSPQKCKK